MKKNKVISFILLVAVMLTAFAGCSKLDSESFGFEDRQGMDELVYIRSYDFEENKVVLAPEEFMLVFGDGTAHAVSYIFEGDEPHATEKKEDYEIAVVDNSKITINDVEYEIGEKAVSEDGKKLVLTLTSKDGKPKVVPLALLDLKTLTYDEESNRYTVEFK